MVDYSIFYKDVIVFDNLIDFQWDLFISAYNSTERVQKTFEKVIAPNKHWLIFPEYGYRREDYPTNEYYFFDTNKEDDYIISYLNNLNFDINKIRICVDITGFIRPHLMYLVRLLHAKKVRSFDVLYSEPIKYSNNENTQFSDEFVDTVRQVVGYEGNINSDVTNDVLIIGSGYDHKLIAKVAEFKNMARKIQIFGLPSLQPDMFQENILRAYKASEAVGQGFLDPIHSYYASASDPFLTASVIQSIVNNIKKKHEITNLYLSPLSTKAQTLGFCLYYIWECLNSNVSIIFPFSKNYSPETSKGLSRITKFTIELPI